MNKVRLVGECMRPSELQCIHGIGHSTKLHGCDGCCAIFLPLKDKALDEVKAELQKILDKRIKISRGYGAPWSQTISFPELNLLINNLYNEEQ